MDSKESETKNQDVALQQLQPVHTPYPSTPPKYQHSEDPNQIHIVHGPGCAIPPIAPPQYPSTAYPNQPVPVQQMPGYQPCVVVNQPMIQFYPQHMVGERPVPNYMCLSIFTTLFCCLCVGIGAMIYSSQANAMKFSKPRAAKREAETALRLNLIGIVIGVTIAIAFSVLGLVFKY